MSADTARHLKTWAWLTALTVAEVLLAGAHVSKTTLVAGLGAMSLWKALLVALCFMHLGKESRWLKAAALVPVALSAIAIVLLLTDTPFLRIG